MAGNFTINIKGNREFQQQLEKQLGKDKTNAITRKAINKAATGVKSNLKSDIEPFKDTGATYDEIVLTNARKIKGDIRADLGWNGPQDRWRLVHLEEWGYQRNGRQIKPRTFGAITKSLKSSEEMYLSTIEQEMRNSL